MTPGVTQTADRADSRPGPLRRLRWGRALTVVLTLATLAFLGLAIADQFTAIRHRLADLSWYDLAGAGALSLLAVVASLASWTALLTGFGARIPLRDAAGVFFVGQIGKYLPGGVWPIVAQARLGHGRNLRAGIAAVTTALTLLLSLLAAVLVGLVFLPLAAGHELVTYAWVYALVPVAAVLVYPPVLARLFALAMRLARRPPIDMPFSGRSILRGLGWAVAQWLLIGLSTALLVRGVGGHGARAWFLALGSYGLAWSGGFLVFVVPAGAGIRESIMTALLSPALPVGSGGGLAVALILRLLLTLADVVLGLAGVAFLGGPGAWRTGAARARDTRASDASAGPPGP